MIRKLFAFMIGLVLISGSGVATVCAQTAAPAVKPSGDDPSGHVQTEFAFGYSIYDGWAFWQFINESGLGDAHAAMYGIKIKWVAFNLDYAESLGALGSGTIHGVTATTIDSFVSPARRRKVAVIQIGDYSNDNDGLVTRGGLTFADLRGVELVLMDNTVSEFLAYRGFELDGKGVKFEDLGGIRNLPDSEIFNLFSNDKGQTRAGATWKPVLTQLRKLEGPAAANMIFGSSRIPQEILDCPVVDAKTLEANPDFGKALVGAIYDAHALVRIGVDHPGTNPEADKAIEIMAKFVGIEPDALRESLRSTTKMYWTPQEALDFARSDRLKEVSTTVRNTSIALAKIGSTRTNGLGINTATPVELGKMGFKFPDGSTIGNNDNVTFVDTYMRMAAEGKLKLKK